MIMMATIVDGLINWTLFTIILSDIAPSGQAAATSLLVSIALVALLFVPILGVGRWVGPRALRWTKAHVTWPSGFIALIALLILAVSSISEVLGLHAFLGAFLIGAALGGHSDEHQEAHDVVSHLVLSFFAPIYFVSSHSAPRKLRIQHIFSDSLLAAKRP
jgi:Kef-type K+ transport system membrane component KefB